MKTFKVYVESVIKEKVEVFAETYEQAIENYYEGNYELCEEIDRQVIDTNAVEEKK